MSRREEDPGAAEVKQRGVGSQGAWWLGNDLLCFKGSFDSLVVVIQWSAQGFSCKWKAAVSNTSFFFLSFSACLLAWGRVV